MAIPALNDQSLLPEGIHECMLDEVQSRFGVFQGNDRRQQLWAKYREFFRDVKTSAIVEAVLLGFDILVAGAGSERHLIGADLGLPRWCASRCEAPVAARPYPPLVRQRLRISTAR